MYSLSGEDLLWQHKKKSKTLSIGEAENMQFWEGVHAGALLVFFWPSIIGERSSSRKGIEKRKFHTVRTRPHYAAAHRVASPHESMQEPSPAFRTPR
jgi:hypothetical protein